MEGWKKFAESLDLTKELEKTYFKIREVFQREGWTQKDIEKISRLAQIEIKVEKEILATQIENVINWIKRWHDSK